MNAIEPPANWKPSEKYTESITFRLTPTQRKELEKAATAAGVSVSTWVHDACAVKLVRTAE